MSLAESEMNLSGLKDIQFGDDIRHKEFCLRPNSVFLNNGSYGTVPKRILEHQKRLLDEMESHPDHWFRRLLFSRWNQARQAVANLVGADVEDLVFVINSTQGVNTVLRSCKLQKGDGILASSLTYGSMKNLWEDMAENLCQGVEGLMLDIKMPIASEDSLVQQYDYFLTHHPNVKLVLIDHITSPSAILMPVKRLIDVCHKHGALVMVDGAHAPGQVHLNLNELGPDFYTVACLMLLGNLNKWAFTPRGCALLWVKREHHSMIRPPQTSWDKGLSLSHQFCEQGTRDHIPFLCATEALLFYEALGGMDRVVGYTSELATRARNLLAEELGLQCLDIPESMEAPNLRMLKLPGVPALCSEAPFKCAGDILQDSFYTENDAQLIFDWVDGQLYLRISIQVFNTLDDVLKLIQPLKRLIATCVPYDDHQ